MKCGMEMICVLMCHTQECLELHIKIRNTMSEKDADSCEHCHTEILYNLAATNYN